MSDDGGDAFISNREAFSNVIRGIEPLMVKPYEKPMNPNRTSVIVNKEYFRIQIRESTNYMSSVHLQQNWESPLDSYVHKKRKMR